MPLPKWQTAAVQKARRFKNTSLTSLIVLLDVEAVWEGAQLHVCTMMRHVHLLAVNFIVGDQALFRADATGHRPCMGRA